MPYSNAIYKAVADCIWGSGGESGHTQLHSDEKAAASMDPAPADERQLASEIVHDILRAEKPGEELKRCLQRRLYANGWRETLARRVLQGLEKAIEAGASMSLATQQAYDKASAAAVEFTKEHPVLVGVAVTLIAIGVLVLLAPYIVEALGFGKPGPIEGSWAALWQSTFPNVPKDSFFSWLQRLGMKCARQPKMGAATARRWAML